MLRGNRKKRRPRRGGAFSYGALKQALDLLGHALELLQRSGLGLAGADLLPDGGGELGEIGLHDRVLCKVGIPIVHTITSGGSLPTGGKVIRKGSVSDLDTQKRTGTAGWRPRLFPFRKGVQHYEEKTEHPVHHRPAADGLVGKCLVIRL